MVDNSLAEAPWILRLLFVGFSEEVRVFVNNSHPLQELRESI